MKEKIIKRLQAIMIEIIKADDAELAKIGIELMDIEKKILAYNSKK